MVIAIVVRFLSFGGFHGSDDGSYTFLAFLMANGQHLSDAYSGLPIFELRVGVVAPVALGFILFGVNEAVVVAYPFILSMVGILVAYFAGSLLFNRPTGNAAALLMALVPLDGRLASYLLPDLPGALAANVGILMLVLSSRQEVTGKKLKIGLIAGLLFGLSWLCKASVVYLLPFTIIWFIWLTVKDRYQLYAFVGFLISFAGVVILETLIYAAVTGDILYRYHTTEKNYELSKMWFFAEGTAFGWQPGQYLPALLKRIFVTGPQIIFIDGMFGGLTLAGLASVLLSFFKRYRYLVFPAMWFLSLVLMFNFGSTSLKAYTPLPLFTKHMFPLLLPSVLCAAGLLTYKPETLGEKHHGFSRPPLALRAIAILVVICFTFMGFWTNFMEGPQNRLEKQTATMTSVEDVIYTDNRTITVLEFFHGYPDETGAVEFEAMRTVEVEPGSYVLVNRSRLVFMAQFYDYILPEFYEAIPQNWKVVLDNKDGELYLVE